MGWALTPRGLFHTLERIVVGEDGRPSPSDAPWSAFKTLEGRRDVRQAALGQKPLVRVLDHQMRVVGACEPIRLKAEEQQHATGVGELEIDADSPVGRWLRFSRRPDSDVHVAVDPVPSRRSWRDRLAFKATVNFKQDSDGRKTVVLNLAHIRSVVEHLNMQPAPMLPPEAQLIKMRVAGPLPARSLIAGNMFLDLARHYGPESLIANPLNPGAWLNALDVADLSPLHWPIQCQFVNPALDSSMWQVLGSAFGTYQEATADILKTSGCQIRAYLWLPEDETSCHPELEALIGPLARPQRACVCLAIEDRSGVDGLLGPVTGLLSLGAKMADDGVTELILPPDPETGEVDPVVAHLLGVAPARPAVVFREDKGGVGESVLTHAPATAHTITTGGKSPQLLNDSIQFSARYGIARLQDLLQGGQFGGTWQVPFTPGLDNIIPDGLLADRIFTHTRVTDGARRRRSGDYAWPEAFERGSGVGWTLSSALSLRAGWWKSRPRIGKTVRLVNGQPWCVGEDFALGDRVGFEVAGVVFAEHVTAIGIEYDQDTPVVRTVSIGETDGEDPIAALVKGVQFVWGLVGAVASGGSAF